MTELGGLDILVNNAGFQMGRRESIADITTDELDRTFKTNLYALFWVTQAALPHLAGRHHHQQLLDPGVPASETLLDYASTKAAINNFTVNLAAELGSRSIRVNAVAPGPIWTPLQPATQPPEKIEKFGEDTPLGRAGQPAEVAPAFVFLASNRRVLRVRHGPRRHRRQAGLLDLFHDGVPLGGLDDHEALAA